MHPTQVTERSDANRLSTWMALTKLNGGTMKYSHATLKSGLLASLAILTAACTNTEDSIPSTSMQPVPEISNPLPLDPEPVASVSLPNGNILEFHDFQSNLMLMETGKAGNAPFLDGTRPTEALAKAGAGPDERLSEIWKLAAPGSPMPQILKEIEARFKNLPSPGMSRERSTPQSGIYGESSLGSTGQPLSKAAAPDGCNNGCCDYEWLATLNACRKFWEFNWFNFNYNWSKVTSTSIDSWSGMVCAANGSSIWKVSISSGNGGNWTVPQGHYKTYKWYKETWDKDATSTVNSSASPALHTFCGNVSY